MPIRVEEHVWITLSDGCRLGARLWLPEGAGRTPVPAILEYIPYRKRDGTRSRDEPMHGYFAEAGYAAVRVDLRGSGESDGHLADEYLKQEQDDALEVIAWIAAQPWCTGAVGMMGKSWGGFNALQVAARRPPALKAIITVCSTDNRYADDVHYMGGCVLNDNLWWGSIMLAYQARPLDPEIVGPNWRERWLERVRTIPFFPALWLAHQRYDAYWKHGSVCEDFSAITCPVLAVGGWADAYTNAVPRLLARLSVPRLGIIGPWAHIYPQDGVPGPAIGFLQEAVRWWDHWLKDRDSGIMREPMLRAYIEEWFPPEGTRMATPGGWLGEVTYPSPNIKPRRFHLRADRGLGESAGGRREFSICSPQSHGKASGEWMGAGVPGEYPTDQRLDDGGALVFETPALDEDIVVLGAPLLRLELSTDVPVAHLVARLSDVAPDGRATRVSYQVLNLTHRSGDEEPEPLEPGRFYNVTVKLSDCGHHFPPGHRIRLSIGTAYWPIIWPAPYSATLAIRTGDSVLELPVRRAGAHEPAVAFEPPTSGRPAPMTQIGKGSFRRYSLQDHVTGEAVYITEGVGGLFGEGILRYDEIGTELSQSLKRELVIRDDDPLSARYVITQSYEMGRDGWRISVRTQTEMRSDRDNFYVSGSLSAAENGKDVAERKWSETIRRDLV